MPYFDSEALIKRRANGFGKKPLTQEEFIKKASIVHENKYDYSKTVYVPAVVIDGKQKRTKIRIICPIHGEFYQDPQNHLLGKGCPHRGCYNCEKLTKESFIEKAVQVHGKFYDYSKVEYINSSTKVCIICPIHGSFLQTPHGHAKNGCHKCSTDKQKLKLKDFVDRANVVHENIYDYSKVAYNRATDKICIICKKHGDFYQRAYSHLEGFGCPHCNTSKGERLIRGWFIEHNLEFQAQYKFDDLRGLNKRNLKFDFYIPVNNLLIEFDGRQHFQPVQFNGHNFKKSEEAFKRLQVLDSLKTEYCLNKGIPLLRISYKDIDRIPEILSGTILAPVTKVA